MAIQVDAPVRTPYRYGLLSTAQVVEQGRTLRFGADYVFDTVACGGGMIWNTECENTFTVTFTRTAAADTFSVTVSPGVVGDYTYEVNGGGPVALTNPVVIADAAPITVEVCEVGGLGRCVTRTDVDPDSAEGTTYVFQSTQSNNLPKSISEGIDTASADAFVVIGAKQCTLIARDAGDDDDPFATIQRRGREALASAEARLVEQQFWAQLAAGTPAILGGGAVTLTKAVALLEEYLRNQTGFTGMIHADAYVGPYASAADLIPETNPETTKRTALWTPWVFGGGYDTTTGPAGQPAPGPDQAYIYATGQVIIHRGDYIVNETFTVTSNQALVVSERSYVVLHDCPIAAVLVQLEPEVAP